MRLHAFQPRRKSWPLLVTILGMSVKRESSLVSGSSNRGSLLNGGFFFFFFFLSFRFKRELYSNIFFSKKESPRLWTAATAPSVLLSAYSFNLAAEVTSGYPVLGF